MTDKFEGLQKFSKHQLEAVSAATASFARGLQSIAAETTDYSKKAFEDHAAYLEKLLAAKSFESVMQIQSEYARTAFDASVEQAKTIGDLYASFTRDALKPLEAAIAQIVATR